MSFSSITSHRAKAGLPALMITLLLLAGYPAVAGAKQVRLLIPILTGTELDQVRKLAPTAAIVTINGETFLEVGTFSDARVAHRLGRSIQKRLSIPFDLAYDPGHPQIALALGDEPQKPSLPVAQQATTLVKPVAVLPAPKPVASDPIWQPMVAGLQAAQLDAVQQKPQQAEPLEAVHAAAPDPADPTHHQFEAVKPQPKLLGQPEPVLAANPRLPEPLVQAEADTKLTSDIALSPSELRADVRASQPPEAVVEEVPEAIPAVDSAARNKQSESQIGPQIITEVSPAQGLVESEHSLATVSTEHSPLEAADPLTPEAASASTAVAVTATLSERQDFVKTDPLLTANAERLMPEMQQERLTPQAARQTEVFSSIVTGEVNSNTSLASAPLERLDAPATQQVPSAVAQLAPEPQTALERSKRLLIPGRQAWMDRHTNRPRTQTAQTPRVLERANQETDKAQKAAKSHPWLKPVEIAAVKIDIPLSRSGVAVNPNLNYLYVKIQNPTDVARLNRITPVMELNPVGDAVLARVGVYTQTRTGRRLMEAQINQLKQQQVDLIVADVGRSLDLFSQA